MPVPDDDRWEGFNSIKTTLEDVSYRVYEVNKSFYRKLPPISREFNMETDIRLDARLLAVANMAMWLDGATP